MRKVFITIIIGFILCIFTAISISYFNNYTDKLFAQTNSDNSPFALHDPSVPEVDSVQALKELGIGWIRYAGGRGIVWDRNEPEKGQYDWSYHDRLYLKTYNSGIKLFISTITASRAYNVEHGYMPKDINSYIIFLKKAVERYDGDGIDDAPGSPVVSVWQIENESDIFWKDTPENYAKLLKISYTAIKQVNNKAKVAISGVGRPEGYDKMRRFYIRVFDELSRNNPKPVKRYFDIFDFHWYPFTTDYKYLIEPHYEAKPVYLADYITKIKSDLNKYGYSNTPIYITETAQYDGKPSPSRVLLEQAANKLTEFHSEKRQALFLFKMYVYSIVKGIDKIFWVTLTEWHNFGNDPDALFDHVGLIHNPLNNGQHHKKLAYYTYKKLIEILQNSDWNNIQTIQETNGIHIYRFSKNKTPIWIAWNDNINNYSKIVISNIPSNKAIITEALPKYDSGKAITNDNKCFNYYFKRVVDSKLTIDLGESPVYITITDKENK